MGTAGPIVYGCSRGPLCSAQLDRVQQRGAFDCFFLFQAEDGIRYGHVTGVQTCALPIVGLGIGALQAPLPSSVREISGPAVRSAEEAVRAARATSQVPLAVRAADPRQRETAGDAEAVLRLIGWMARTRNRGQWRVVRALREDPHTTQAELAQRLGITQQTVSRALKTSGWREESAAHPLAVRLLSMIDLTSTG